MKRNGFKDFAIPLAIILSGVVIHCMGTLNHDVAFMVWACREILHGAVLGKDIIEINFPLAFLVYAPAVLLSKLFPLPLATRAWIILLAIIAVALSWKDVPPSRRLVMFSALAAYVGLAWPREFGQREGVAFLMVFAYVVPGERHGWRAIVTGALAAVGFAIKPHFLLAWLVIEVGRKPFRTEQIALIGTGAFYALALLFCFREYTFGFLPDVLKMYEASNRIYAAPIMLVPTVASLLGLVVSMVVRDELARAMSVAALGFGIAAFLQFKFYNYHLMAMCGFAVLAFVSLLCSARGTGRLLSGATLLVVLYSLAPPVIGWWADREGHMRAMPYLLKGLEGARTFIVMGSRSYPAFPTALYAEERGTRFLGTACCTSFLPAAVAGNSDAMRMARSQLLRELRRHPDVVLVDIDYRRQTNIPWNFDGLAWYLADPDIAKEWANYRLAATAGPYRFYWRNIDAQAVVPDEGGISGPSTPAK